MYNSHLNGVGADPEPASPSLWDSFVNIATKGVQAGFNMYNKVTDLKAAKQQTQAVQQLAAQAQQVALYQQARPGMVPTGYAAPGGGFMDTWGLPLLIAGAGLVAVAVMKKK